MNDENNKNPFRVLQGGKPDQDAFPVNEYAILDVDNNEFFAFGFAVFTSHHIAIMRDEGSGGPIPVFVIPLTRVKACELVDEDESPTEEPAPF